ncbi:hypothetical protein FR932_07630 [Moritella marina ATCC 15381]|uniref:DUF3080 domain-containing protein n=1 Tax=Moritella marina ATCC 15381 TaxID=1202962 RepID=A0A5J6WKX4_MORMI|nr:hypothetical protein [Moritella marina]QFI37730.1 hypothetical protein FR932_07630 [Moritella marina ATCC 15381]
MNKLLLGIAMCLSLSLSACTNWPDEGYFTDLGAHTEERVLFKQHYDYLNLHLSVANLRGAQACIPAYVKTVNNINSRVAKSIEVEDPQDIKVEIAILEKHITNLVVQLNQVTSNTNCAQPSRILTSNFVHPLIYQLDLLLYCAPQFETGNAILTAEYKACLRQVSFLLLDNPKIVVEYTKYKLFENTVNKKSAQSNLNYNDAIVIHDMDTIVDDNAQPMEEDKGVDDYNEIMRQYLLFEQVPSVNVEQLSRLQINIEQHTPVQIHEIDTSNEQIIFSNKLAVNTYATSLDDVELLNLRTDAIFNYLLNITAEPLRHKVLYEDLRRDAITSSTPIISTLMWQSEANQDVNHKVKDWRFLLNEGEQFNDASLFKGIAL